MFRLFRRGKKEKKEKKKEKEDKKSTKQAIKNAEVDTAESTYAEKIVDFSKTIAESIPEIPEEPEVIEPIIEFFPLIKTIVESEKTVQGFISPEILKYSKVEGEAFIESYKSTELTPITLEERIEGAMFSVGRPIHTSELIENFQEDSTHLKRTLRKVSRSRTRNSPIILHEISKDRWVLQLNPIYHDFFYSLSPKMFMTDDKRRIITEIAYRQPISLAMVKKIVKKIGPFRINEICKKLEEEGYIIGEKRARSIVYTSTPKFASDFGFDDESRRLKLQMLWRLKRLMGDYEAEEEEKLPEEVVEEELPEETEKVTDGEEQKNATEEETEEISIDTIKEQDVKQQLSGEKEDQPIEEQSEEELPIVEPLITEPQQEEE
jgi:chromosome segregation and condensation protein ScpB